MESIKETNSGITRTGIGDRFRPCCESTESSSLSFRTCEICGAKHDGTYGSGRFCSYSCKQKYTAIRGSLIGTSIIKEKYGIECQCEFCKETFKSKRDYKKHLLNCSKRIKYASRKYNNWVCSYCGIVFETKRLLDQHKKCCEEFAKLPKDSLGRTIPTYDRSSVAKKALKEKIARGEKLGKPHTEETRKRLSDIRIKYLETHPNRGLQWFEVDGIKVQGTWEKRFAEYLVSKSIKFERNKLKFCKTHTYTPDFYCPDYNIYFEVKGFRRDRDIYKMYLVLDEHPNVHIKMIEKDELENLDNIDIFNLPDFQEKYKYENIDMSKFNNIWVV